MRIPVQMLVPLVVLVAGAAGAGSGPSLGARHYGEPLPDGRAVSVADAIADFDRYAGQARNFSGRITQVCQAKGCWTMLETDGAAARVMFGNHAFFIPVDSTGNAVVHGALTRHRLSPVAALHVARDAGHDRPDPELEYRIVADGVRISTP